MGYFFSIDMHADCDMIHMQHAQARNYANFARNTVFGCVVTLCFPQLIYFDAQIVALPQIAGGDTRATSTYLACDQKRGRSRIVFWGKAVSNLGYFFSISMYADCNMAQSHARNMHKPETMPISRQNTSLAAMWHNGMHATCTSAVVRRPRHGKAAGMV